MLNFVVKSNFRRYVFYLILCPWMYFNFCRYQLKPFVLSLLNCKNEFLTSWLFISLCKRRTLWCLFELIKDVMLFVESLNFCFRNNCNLFWKEVKTGGSFFKSFNCLILAKLCISLRLFFNQTYFDGLEMLALAVSQKWGKNSNLWILWEAKGSNLKLDLSRWYKPEKALVVQQKIIRMWWIGYNLP